MLQTLGLDDDWDPIDVLEHIEAAFGVKIGDAEAKKIFLVGQMYDTLKEKLGNKKRVPNLCYSSKAFYRLRLSLQAYSGAAKISPSDDLLHLFRGRPPRKVRGVLEEDTGLKLPKLKDGVSQIAGAILFFGSIIAFVAAFAGTFSFLFAALILAAGTLLINLPYGKRFSGSYSNLGVLAQKVAALNYGLLVDRYGVPTRPRLWEALTVVLADYSNVDASEIGTDTRFLDQKVDMPAS